MNTEVLPINEAYACIQAEGKYQGVPHILIRFTGCPLRCQFSATDFCDTPYSSWTPEKGNITWESLCDLYEQHPHIKFTMITGGSPTMHPDYLISLVSLAQTRYDQFVTIETEGSAYVKTSANFISLSPKLKSSIPIEGSLTPWGKTVAASSVLRHTQLRLRQNFEAHKKLLQGAHYNYQVKFVVTCLEDLEEIATYLKTMNDENGFFIPNNRVWLMPAGATKEALEQHRVFVIESAIRLGYNYTDRIHIVAYGTRRGV